MTIFVGYKTRAKLLLIGAFWVLVFYILANIVLTIIAIINYKKAAYIPLIYEGTILDDLDKL